MENEWQQKRRINRANYPDRYMAGVYGKGMHDFVLRETEVGFRAAAMEDSEYCSWSALDDLSYAEYVKSH